MTSLGHVQLCFGRLKRGQGELMERTTSFGSQIMPVSTWKTINSAVCRVLACRLGTSIKRCSSTALQHLVSKVASLACKGKLQGHVCGRKRNPSLIWQQIQRHLPVGLVGYVLQWHCSVLCLLAFMLFHFFLLHKPCSRMNLYFGNVKQSSPDLAGVPYTHIKRPLKPGTLYSH